MELKAYIKKHGFDFLANFIGVLVIIPLAPFICRFIPPMVVGDFNFDLIASLLLAILLVRLFIWLLKPMMIPLLVFCLLFFAYKQIRGTFTVFDIFRTYRGLVRKNYGIKEQKATDMLSLQPALFENKKSRTERLVKAKMNFQDSLVRNFSIQHSLDYFKEFKPKYGYLARYFSLFKYINQHFSYVPDPARDEYYATAHETIVNGLGGDCDDHSILMANCLMDIGARCRLVVVSGHMYPELYIGDKEKFIIAQQAVIQMFSNYVISGIYYHENNGEYWINMDYTAHYPGGPYLNDEVKLVIDF